MDNQFHPTLYSGCNYSLMLRFKLNCVSKRGYCAIFHNQPSFYFWITLPIEYDSPPCQWPNLAWPPGPLVPLKMTHLTKNTSHSWRYRNFNIIIPFQQMNKHIFPRCWQMLLYHNKHETITHGIGHAEESYDILSLFYFILRYSDTSHNNKSVSLEQISCQCFA